MTGESENRSKKRKTKSKNNYGNNYNENDDDDELLRKKLREKLETDKSWNRPVGDGESLPETPPNEVTSSSPPSSSSSSTFLDYSPFNVQISVDVMACLLFSVGLFTRIYALDQPKNVVFDEMHYGKYASLYLKRVFFFDSNPPLGKLLIAAASYFFGYNGDFSFDKIGAAYPEDVPVRCLRAVPAFCGATLSPLVYLIVCQLGLSPWSGALAGFMVIFDTALLTQSRYVLLESIMMMFSLISILAVLKFRNKKPFSFGWTFWMLVSIISVSCAFCVKYLGFYSMVLVVWIAFKSFWKRLADKSLSNFQLFSEMIVQTLCFSIIPISIYMGIFYIHLSILTKAGVHDSLMTSAFQASLEGGLSSIIQGQPSLVAHGSQITLRHTHGKTCWLHSHEHVYPVRYSDSDRGSSHQQQVSCYGYKDVNNWWIVKRPDREDLAVHEPLDVIRDGDVIQLVHGLTHRALNSHDVAAPMSPHNQEVSCYIDYNISMSAENLWKVVIANSPDSEEKVWYSIGSQVRLIHETTGYALKFSGRLYPDWGFHQNEVVADKNVNQIDTIWNVEEHRYTKNDEDKKALERELITSELIPTKQTEMTFLEKFVELQIKMLITDQENVQNHNYASDPSEWPFLSRGIAYFIAKDSNAQVHLLGNIAIWYMSTVSLILFCGLLVIYLLRRRRLCFDISKEHWNQFVEVSEVIFVGYLIHYLPFFFYDKTLFLHHYLPAYLFKIMLSAYLINHLNTLSRNKYVTQLLLLFTLLWCIIVLIVYYHVSTLSYGTYPLKAQDVKALKWKDSWDLIIHKP